MSYLFQKLSPCYIELDSGEKQFAINNEVSNIGSGGARCSIDARYLNRDVLPDVADDAVLFHVVVDPDIIVHPVPDMSLCRAIERGFEHALFGDTGIDSGYGNIHLHCTTEFFKGLLVCSTESDVFEAKLRVVNTGRFTEQLEIEYALDVHGSRTGRHVRVSILDTVYSHSPGSMLSNFEGLRKILSVRDTEGASLDEVSATVSIENKEVVYFNNSAAYSYTGEKL